MSTERNKMQQVLESLAQELVPFGSPVYFAVLAAAVFARGMDLISTWTGTPTFLLEANPIARLLGWKLGIFFNLVMCVFISIWPLMAVVVITTSLLVAARNFKSAWIMRTMGENHYLTFILNQMSCASRSLILFCIFGEAGMFLCVGLALVLLSPPGSITMGIGTGVFVYGLVVGFFASLPLLKTRSKLS